ncbi:hypothetical protein [Microbulbifer sp.]
MQKLHDVPGRGTLTNKIAKPCDSRWLPGGLESAPIDDREISTHENVDML